MVYSSSSLFLATQVLIKPAQQDDCDDIWRWRNDPASRANSLDNSCVPYDKHCTWFKSVLSDHNKFLMLGIAVDKVSPENNHKIGMVRFEVVSNNEFERADTKIADGAKKAIVSINLNPEFRGKGFCASLLSQAIVSLKKDFASNSSLQSIRYIEATIKEENIASIKCFEKAGFVPLPMQKSHQYTLAENHSQRQFQFTLV